LMQKEVMPSGNPDKRYGRCADLFDAGLLNSQWQHAH
jgi:hypothetical protein